MFRGEEVDDFRPSLKVEKRRTRDPRETRKILPLYLWRLTMALSDRRAMVTCGVASLMNGALNLIIFMYKMVYDHHFSEPPRGEWV